MRQRALLAAAACFVAATSGATALDNADNRGHSAAHVAHAHKKHLAFRHGHKHRAHAGSGATHGAHTGAHGPGPVMPHASAIGLGAAAIGGAAIAAGGAAGSNSADNAHGCVWRSPSGSTFDLSSLADTEFHLNGAGGFRYSLSVCKSLRALPLRCGKGFPDGAASASAIQEDAFGNCHVLGSTKHVTFAQADAHDPGRGVIVTYAGGAPCADGHPRTLRVHLTCSPTHPQDAAPASVAEAGDSHGSASCAYDVTWPSPHGCPLSSLSSLLLHARMGVLGSSGGAHALHVNARTPGLAPAAAPHGVNNAAVPHAAAAVAVIPTAAAGSEATGFWTISNLLWLSTVLWYGGLALYCALGSIANVWAGRGECGWSAIPHKAYWDAWLEAMAPARLRAKALALPVLGHALTACVAVVGAAASVCHWGIIGTRAVWNFSAGGIGRRLPASWKRTRWFLGAGDAAGGSNGGDKGKGNADAAAAAAGSDASVRLKAEGGVADGSLVRRIAGASGSDGSGASRQPTFAADVKNASAAAARRAGANGAPFAAADFAAVRIDGYSMRAEQSAAGAGAAASAAASSSARGAGAGADATPPQGLGQDEDGHGTPFGPSVATADLLLRGDTGMAPQAGAPVPQPPVVKRR